MAPTSLVRSRRVADRAPTHAVAARPLRVLVTVKKRGWNGETAHVLDLATGLRAAGHDVLLGARPDSESALRAGRRGVPVLPLRLVHAPTAVTALARDVAVLRTLLPTFDVVHTHASWDTWVVATARVGLHGAPALVRSRHNLKPIRDHGPNRWLYGRAITALVAPARTIADDLRAAPLVDTERVRLVRHGTDLTRFDARRIDRAAARAELRQLCETSEGAPVVVYVSRIVPGKEPELLLDAAERLRGRFPALRVVLAGAWGGPDEWQSAMRGRIRALAPFVSSGFVDDVPRLLAGADVFALPSAREGLGLATLEAGAMGCPAVGARAAGSAETIEHGVTGLLFAPGDSAGCTAAIERLLGDPDLRARFGAAASERVRELHDARRMIAGYVDLYAHVAGVRAPVDVPSPRTR